MPPFLAELIGTMFLVVFSDAVVAAVLLAKSKAFGSGWIVIATGQGWAVVVAIYVAGWASGGHVNPAVTIGLASIGKFPLSDVPIYLAGQAIGGFVGAVLVWLIYLPHWAVTDSPYVKLSVFSTVPAIRNLPLNLLTEVLSTSLLVLGILAIVTNFEPSRLADAPLRQAFSLGVAPLGIGVLVLVVTMCLGGATGPCLNPARDLGPRIAHWMLPIPGKGGSDWAYAWVPVLGPIAGGLLGAAVYALLYLR